MAAGKFNDLSYLCLRHFVGEDAADPHPVAVDMQHDLDGLVPGLAEEALKDEHDEFHRRVVVVQEENLVEARFLGLGPRFRDHARTRAPALA